MAEPINASIQEASWSCVLMLSHSQNLVWYHLKLEKGLFLWPPLHRLVHLRSGFRTHWTARNAMGPGSVRSHQLEILYLTSIASADCGGHFWMIFRQLEQNLILPSYSHQPVVYQCAAWSQRQAKRCRPSQAAKAKPWAWIFKATGLAAFLGLAGQSQAHH